MREGKSARFYRRGVAVAALAAMALGAALAADAAYKLDLGMSLRANSLSVEPTLSGPAGKALRYEVKIRREGKGGTADNNRSGTVRLDALGKGQLGYNSLSIAPGDRYAVAVKVYDGGRVVAEESAHYP